MKEETPTGRRVRWRGSPQAGSLLLRGLGRCGTVSRKDLLGVIKKL